MAEKVSFSVHGTEVRADLYLPADLKPGEKRPGMVIGHGFSSVKEMLVEQGEFFVKAGYVVLAIDYRSFGESGGEVRGELFPERQVEDYSAGITYLQGRPEVEADRIAIWGTSFAGSIVLAVGARDRRARVVIAQIPIVDAGRWMAWLRTSEQWETLLDAIDEDRARRLRGEPSRRIPVMGPFNDPNIVAMPTSADVVKFSVTNPPGWRNDLSLESMEKILSFNPLPSVDKISPRPLCLIMNTGYEVLHCFEHVMEAFAAANEPKKMVLLPYDQLGFYAEEGQEAALGAALDFLKENLPIGSSIGGAVPRSGFADA